MHILKDKRGDDASIALIGNKSDLEVKRKIARAVGLEKAKKFDAFFMEVSAKTGEQVFDLFQTLTSTLTDSDAGRLGADTDIKLNVPKLEKKAEKKKKKKKCC